MNSNSQKLFVMHIDEFSDIFLIRHFLLVNITKYRYESCDIDNVLNIGHSPFQLPVKKR